MGEVLVVGAGVTGLCCAYQLARRGWNVQLLEQAGPGQNLSGASHGESRIIRLIHSQPLFLPLARDSYAQWRRLEHEVGAKLFENHGLLWLGDERGSRARAELLKQFDAPHELLGPEQLAARYQHLRYGEGWWAVLDHTAGTIYARRSTEALKKALLGMGVRVRYNCRVTGWTSTETGVRVQTSKGDGLSAEQLVLAAGGWLEQLAPGLRVRVRPSLVGVFFWDVARQAQGLYQPANRAPNLIISDWRRDEELFLIPEADFAGKVKFGVHLGEEFDILQGKQGRPDFVDRCRELSRRHIAEHLPHLEQRPSVETTCLYANTDDHSFLLDRHPQHRRVVLASGFSGTGFKFGPVVGDLVADLVEQRAPRFDIRDFAVDRLIDLEKAKL